MPFPDIDPIAFSIGPFAVRWYALAYLGGVLLGALYGWTLLRRKSLWAKGSPPFEAAAIFDFAFWAVIGIVVGGRLGYVLFYNLLHFLANPAEIIAVWDGGMSFHGGLVGIMVAIALFTRAKGGNILSSLDLLGAIGTIGLFLGRIANFINGELYGAETHAALGRHLPRRRTKSRAIRASSTKPLLEGILLFLVIRYVTHVALGLRRPGPRRRHLRHRLRAVAHPRRVRAAARRPDRLPLGGWLTMGMVLSLPILVAGLGLVVYALAKPRG